MKMSKSLFAAGLCLLLTMGTADAQNLVTNGDFASDLSGWTSTPNAPTTISFDGAEGVPAGSAALARNDTAASSNGNYLWQAVPVTNGAEYTLDADWKGDLLNGGSGRNWAEVAVEFNDTGVLTTPIDSSILYKKATDGGPNDLPMPFDWESILASADGGPADGVFTATGDFMIVAFNLGGRDITRNDTQPGFYNVDNVSITANIPEPGTLVLLGLCGGCGLLALRRRRS